jgi:hypothetical protein
MISERKFAITYTSLWREITPSADNFVRHINLASERFVAPYKSTSQPFLNGAINETAFRLCRNMWGRAEQNFKTASKDAQSTWSEVCRWLGEEPVGRYKLTNRVWQDVYTISRNIHSFILENTAIDVVFEPVFPGCGVISQCFGDVIVDEMLVEVKAGDRGFRATDLRQVFIYCALARAIGAPLITTICLMNPRWGVSWTSSVDDAATGCGASSSAELLDDIVRGAVLLGVSS